MELPKSVFAVSLMLLVVAAVAQDKLTIRANAVASVADRKEFDAMLAAVSKIPKYSKIVAYLRTAALRTLVLQRLGKQMTFLLPTDDALNFNIYSYGASNVQKIILFHIIPGWRLYRNFLALPYGTKLPTLSGFYLTRTVSYKDQVVLVGPRTNPDVIPSVGSIVKGNLFMGSKLIAHGFGPLLIPPGVG